jgi:hypothetical protein
MTSLSQDEALQQYNKTAQGELERSIFTDIKVVLLLCKELLSLKLPKLESNQVPSNGQLLR